MFRRKLLFFALLILSCGTAGAQDFIISGKVSDSAGAAVPAIAVSLLQAADSSWVQTGLTDEQGHFSLRAEKGAYLVVVRGIGYRQLLQPLAVTGNVNDLHLSVSRNHTALEEVIVSSKAPRIESGMGKIMVHIDPTTVSAGSTVWELLRKSPGVQVNGNEISLQGKGVLVLLDDKQTYLSGADLKDYLNNLAADQVAQLELISQPSAKYDAEGSGGIINIRTRKLRRRGLNGNTSLSYNQNVYPNTHDLLNLSYRRDKLHLSGTAAYLHATGFLGREDSQLIKDQQTGALIGKSVQNSFQRETFEDYSLQLGIDYAVNDKMSLGGSVKGIYHPNNEKDEAATRLEDAAGNISHNNTYNAHGLLRDQIICNGYARYKPSKNRELSIDADYLRREQQNYQQLNSRNYDAQGQPSGGDLQLRNQSPSLIAALVIKADYSATLPGDWKLEAGVKSSASDTRNAAFFEIQDNGVWRDDTARTNDFRYREQINAAYVSANKAFSKKWKAQLGLRVEREDAAGQQLVHEQKFTRSRTAVFPTAFLSYTADEQNSFELNCGRRVSRPAYTQLNPFIFFLSQYSYSAGNPALAPSYSYFGELKHNYKGVLFTTLSCSMVKGVMTPVVKYDKATRSVFSTIENYSDNRSAGCSLSFSKQFYKWWQLSSSAGLSYDAYTGAEDELLAAALGYYFSFSSELTFPRGWSADTVYYFASGEQQNLLDHYGPRQWMGFNIAKKFWKDSATLRLSVDDPFDLHRVSSSLDWNGVESHSVSRWGNQQIGLGFSYNFGRKAGNEPEHRNTAEEAGRM